MIQKALDLLRTLGWLLLKFVFDLIDSLYDILKTLNSFDIIDSIAKNGIFKNFHSGVLVIALTLLGLFALWRFVMKTSNKLLKLTAEIVSAHVTNNTVDHADIPEIISSTFSALKKVFDASVSLESEALKQKATVRISDSVFPDYIICLEDGKKLKMLI